MYGWTPDQICELTLPQVYLYVSRQSEAEMSLTPAQFNAHISQRRKQLGL